MFSQTPHSLVWIQHLLDYEQIISLPSLLICSHHCSPLRSIVKIKGKILEVERLSEHVFFLIAFLCATVDDSFL